MTNPFIRSAMESLIVEPLICESKFVRWVKTHKRRRIAKKWRKRYGAIFWCPGVMFEIASMEFHCMRTPRQFVCCPCVKAAIDQEIAK